MVIPVSPPVGESLRKGNFLSFMPCLGLSPFVSAFQMSNLSRAASIPLSEHPQHRADSKSWPWASRSGGW